MSAAVQWRRARYGPSPPRRTPVFQPTSCPKSSNSTSIPSWRVGVGLRPPSPPRIYLVAPPARARRPPGRLSLPHFSPAAPRRCRSARARLSPSRPSPRCVASAAAPPAGLVVALRVSDGPPLRPRPSGNGKLC